MDLSFVQRGAPPVINVALLQHSAAAALPGYDASRRSGRTKQIAARLRAGVTNVCAEGFVALIDPRCSADAAPCGSFHPRVAQHQRRSV